MILNKMSYSCTECHNLPKFRGFKELSEHMGESHSLYTCRLCINNMKIFPSQCQWYTTEELTRHVEHGNPNNTSHRSHLICLFCNIRYLDKNDLYMHLRKEHFYCVFCHNDGHQDYFLTYDSLKEHYDNKHYRCTENICDNEQLIVFRTSFELQRHNISFHSQELNQQEKALSTYEFNWQPQYNQTVEFRRNNLYQPSTNISYPAFQQTQHHILQGHYTSNFPSSNSQHTTELSYSANGKLNSAQSLESIPPLNNIQPHTIERINKLNVGLLDLQLSTQTRDFPSLDSNHQQIRTTSSMASSNTSWVSKAKAINENISNAKNELMSKNEKINETSKGYSNYHNLNKKFEPFESNLAKLGDKNINNSNKNRLLAEKISPIEKCYGAQKQTASENNTIKAKDNELQQQTDNLAEVQFNGAGDMKNMTKTMVNTYSMKATEIMKDIAPIALVPEILEEITSATNSPNDKKNENKEFVLNTIPSTSNTLKLSQDNNNFKLNSPKIPPGFENMFGHMARSPLLTSEVSKPQPQFKNDIKVPPGLFFNNYKHFEYLHSVSSIIRNKMLNNNLMQSVNTPYGNRIAAYEEFIMMSNLFRQYNMTSYDFYIYCMKALNPYSFKSVFQELVLLLPDIQKQQELLFIYNKYNSDKMNVEVCKFCFQVLKAKEVESHMPVHIVAYNIKFSLGHVTF